MEFQVSKMSCGHCVATIEKALTAADQSTSMQADLDTRTVRVSSSLSADELMQVLDEAGYAATHTAHPDPA